MFLNLFVTQIFALPWDEWGGDIDVYLPFPQTQTSIDRLTDDVLFAIKTNLWTGNGVFEDAVILTFSSAINPQFQQKEFQDIAEKIRISAIHAQYIIFDVSNLTASQLAQTRKQIYALEKTFIAQKPAFKVGAFIEYGDDKDKNKEMINLITQDPNKNSYLGIKGDLGAFIQQISNTAGHNYQAFNDGIEFFDLSETAINESNIQTFTKYLETFHNLAGLDLTESLFKNFSTNQSDPQKQVNQKNTLFDPNTRILTPIANVLKNLHKITFLNLSSNALDENSGFILANIIKSFDHLIYINVSYNYIGGRGGDAFLNSLENQKQLALLNISNNKFNAQNADSFVNAIKNKGFISFADISYNFFASEGMHKIFLAISNPLILESLQVAKMRKNYYLHKTWADKKVGSVEFSKLFYLDMGENYFYSQPAQSTTEPAIFPPTLRYLYLDSNNISPTRMATLAAALIKAQHVHYLDLSKNNIGSAGVKSLIDILEQARDLNGINLSENNFNAQNMIDISNAMTTFPIVKNLTFSKNTFNKEGIMILSSFFAKDRKLITLELSKVDLSDDAAVILATGLTAQNDLSVLDLTYNNIDQNGLKAILNSIKNKPNFTTLGLTGNKVSCDDVTRFVEKQTFKCI